MNKKLKLTVYTALMTAFVFIMTSAIKIPIPFTNGYIHAGDTFIFLSGILLGPWYGAFAAGVGSALADFFGGYAQWMLPTLLIKSVMGFIVGYFASETRNQKHVLIGTITVWLIALFAFLLAIRSASIETLMNTVEAMTSLEVAQEMSKSMNFQLIATAIVIPAFSVIMFHLKDKYGLSFNQLIGMVVAGIWMVLGYYVAGSLMYGSFIASIFSIPWNVVQFGIGGILAFLVNAALKKAHITAQTLRKFN